MLLTTDGQSGEPPTGRMGSAKDLEPEADEELIARIVTESARHLPENLIVATAQSA